MIASGGVGGAGVVVVWLGRKLPRGGVADARENVVVEEEEGEMAGRVGGEDAARGDPKAAEEEEGKGLLQSSSQRGVEDPLEVREGPGCYKWVPLRLLRSRWVLVPIRKFRDLRTVRDWAQHFRFDSGCQRSCCKKAGTASEASRECAVVARGTVPQAQEEVQIFHHVR